jgi:hypothetical protein
MSNNTILRRKFLNSLKRGTGEAHIIGQKNPSIDFTDLIIKGIKRNYAYDGQCEPSRGQYIYDLFSFSKRPDKLREAIINALVNRNIDSWDLTHLSDLAKIYVQATGDNDIKNLIYERFLTPINYSGYWYEGEIIIELDGFSGLVYVCEKLGNAIQNGTHENIDDWMIRFYEEKYETTNTRQRLETISKENEALAAFLSATKSDCNISTMEPGVSNKIESEDIIDRIMNSRGSINLQNWSKKEIMQFANRLITEKNVDIKRNLLWFFTRVKYPLDYKYILNLADRRKRSDLQYHAVSSLAFFRNSEVRNFAIKGIVDSRLSKWELPGYFDILRLNYRATDSILLCKLIVECSDENRLHDISQGCIAIYEKVRTKKCQVPLELLYDRTCCGHCRWSIVKILINNNALSQRITEEIQYDSDLDLRTIYEEVTKNIQP